MSLKFKLHKVFSSLQSSLYNNNVKLHDLFIYGDDDFPLGKFIFTLKLHEYQFQCIQQFRSFEDLEL